VRGEKSQANSDQPEMRKTNGTFSSEALDGFFRRSFLAQRETAVRIETSVKRRRRP
jgi:hypothetical protein